MKVTVLAGGVGAARFLEGLVLVLPQEDITVISNTGDDEEFFGLHVSPDIDIVIYTLAGAVDETKGWGLRDESFEALFALGRFGYETWFGLGDRDLATHVVRTQMLAAGATLSEATRAVAAAYGLRISLLPVSDDRIRTVVETSDATFAFQEYFVKRRTQDEVRAIHFEGSAQAIPAPGIRDAMLSADVVIIAPSNPVVSLGPMLAVPGLRELLRETRANIVGVSPIVAGKTIKGPADRMMAALGIAPSAVGVAAMYRDFLDVLVIDEQDAHLAPQIGSTGIRTVVAQTIMRGPAEKQALAQAVLGAVQ